MRTVDQTRVRIADPDVLPVTLDAAKHCLKVDGDALNLGIEMWIAGMVPQLEHEIGQCLIEQGWEVRQRCFTAKIPLPHPVIAIDDVTFIDQAGVQRSVAPADYQIDAGRYASYLVPAFGKTWPAASDGPGAVKIRLRSGYGSTPDAVPRNVQLYILAKLVEQFDPATQSDKGGTHSPFLDRLLDACRSH